MRKQLKKPTLTIGIPAHNEEANIEKLLNNLLKQEQKMYVLETIYVVCDGCTDKTSEIVTQYAKKHSIVKLMDDKKRIGKANRLNMIYKLNKSDYLLTIDADTLFVGTYDIDAMIKTMINDKRVQLVGPRHIPIKPKSLMGKFAYLSYISFEDAFLQLNNGNNSYAIMSVELLKKDFAKSFTFPPGTIADQYYAYAIATKGNPHGFKLVQEAKVYFQPVTTFIDWRKLGVRSTVIDKQNVTALQGKNANLYTMPKNIYSKSLIKWFFKSPVYTTGSVLMNLYIRKFPYQKDLPKNGVWEVTKSSRRLDN